MVAVILQAIGWLNASDVAGVELTEIDVTAAYVLAKGVTYKIGVAYGIWDGASAADDPLVGVGNSITVKW